MTEVPEGFEDIAPAMRAAHERIVAVLCERGYRLEDYPLALPPGRRDGQAAALAYPIQGILKYHGLSDWEQRIAYLPSISVNNDAAHTVTLVSFEPSLPADRLRLNGQEATGRPLERVSATLDVVRSLAHIQSHALVESRNVVRASRTGKGLGTSASASAALAMAALAAALGTEAVANQRLLSCLARLLAGSGCRSATGGVSLWLSYPGAAHEDSFALRLDEHDELADLALLTVPLDSRIGLSTEQAHREAPHSPFFRPWMWQREAEVLECLAAVQARDWRTLGQLAELDSIRLHGVTMTASRENKLFAWEPENIPLFRLCNRLRTAGVPVYFSTDTGPTTVFLTHRDTAATVAREIGALADYEVVSGRVAGPARLLPVDEARSRLTGV
ncbi:MAG: GHMP kinase [Anaerolineales bacterium]